MLIKPVFEQKISPHPIRTLTSTNRLHVFRYRSAPSHQIPGHIVTEIQAVMRPTIRRTHGATIATVGKATGHVVKQLFIHCATKPDVIPCDTVRTKAETMQTMMIESNALNRIGA